MTERIAVETPDGEMAGYLWRPEGGSGPGILLLQEIFGVSRYIRRRAADLAAAGYVVLVPELYWRLDRQEVDESAPDAVEQAMALAGEMDPATAVTDAVAAFARLEAVDGVDGVPAVAGFCLGGGLAFSVAAATEPTALVSYYGSALPQLLDLAPQVTCPSLHHFGTADDYIDAAAVEAITRAVTADGRPAQVELYEGANHAFDNDDFFLYHEESSRRAWETTLAFLRRHLPV
ncbi:MAG TPA: dienelactone hydrolase family protein [Nocardioides sp.]|nr:dienelactone hydrolase family protein [Nocardioides sp.]